MTAILPSSEKFHTTCIKSTLQDQICCIAIPKNPPPIIYNVQLPTSNCLTSEQSSHHGYVLLQLRAWGSQLYLYCISNCICAVFVIVFLLCSMLPQVCAWGLEEEVGKADQLVKCQPVKFLESWKKPNVHWVGGQRKGIFTKVTRFCISCYKNYHW